MSGTTIDRGLEADSGLLQSIAHPKVTNFLDIQKSALDTAQGVWANRSAQAQQAWGDVLQQSTDPQTGVVDYAKANALAAGRPDATFGMMKGLQSSTELTGATQDQGIKRNAAIINAMAPLANMPDDQIHDGAIQIGEQLISSGLITRADFNKRLAAMPNDPAQLRTLIERQRQSLLPPEQQQANIYGRRGTQDTGGEIQHGTYDERTGAWIPATATPHTMTPGQLATTVEYTHPKTGQPMKTSLEEFYKVHDIPIPGAAPPGGGSGVPSTLRRQGAPGSTAPAPAAAPPPSGQPRGGATGPAPDTAAQWEASTKQYTADNEAAGSYQRRIFPLAQSRALLESGDVTTGKGAEALQGLKGILTTAAGQFGWNVNTINNAKYEELKKYQTDYINSNPFAAGSDQRLASAITGNPSSSISTLANKDVTKALIALERMKQAAISDFKAKGGAPRDYANYLSSLQNDLDPRAFAVDMIDPEKLDKMLKTPADRERFSKTLAMIERNPGIMSQAAMPQR